MAADSLNDYIDQLPIISTHEHTMPFPPDQPGTLDYLFAHAYCGWCGIPTVGPGGRERFLELMNGKSYFVWYEKALDDLFGFGGKLTPGNWDEVSSKVAESVADPGFHEMVFRDKCRYRLAILDSYWDPGSNHRPDLFAPTFRINSFIYGRSPETRDHNGNNAQLLYGRCKDLDEYLAMIETQVARAKANGAVALKSALAYDRDLRFKPRDKREVAGLFNRANVTPDEETAFGDLVYDHICSLAEKYDLPFQNHVGLGKLGGSHPMGLVPMIEKHPGTRFVLFHMGYPWIDEVCALSHNYRNVYPDMCWVPSIGPSAAVRALNGLIETANDAGRACWGGDSWLLTESYAASLSMRWALKRVLREKVDYGYMTESDARAWADRILHQNAADIYGL